MPTLATQITTESCGDPGDRLSAFFTGRQFHRRFFLELPAVMNTTQPFAVVGLHAIRVRAMPELTDLAFRFFEGIAATLEVIGVSDTEAVGKLGFTAVRDGA